jgi:diacylglycerol kinase (ATP)
VTPPGGDPKVSFLRWTALRLGWAFRGLWWFLKEPQNLWVHLPAALLVVVVGWLLGVDRTDWCLLIIAIAIVLVAEGLNSALESLADAVHPAEHPLVGRAKDVAAGAVLLASFAAAAIGLIVFVPKLLAPPGG